MKNAIKKAVLYFSKGELALWEISIIFILSSFFVFDKENYLTLAVSVMTSFLAVYLTFRRSRFFALAYAANDIVLIILWTLAAFSDISYISVIICFAVFFANDIYGFINRSKMRKKQEMQNA